MRLSATLLLACAVAPAFPGDPAQAPEGRDALLARWEGADPEERRRLAAQIERLQRAQRFAHAGPVLVAHAGETWSVAELFTRVLEPALQVPAHPRTGNDPGLAEIHLLALEGLADLRRAYAAPQPVGSGTLNLLLDYAARTLRARELDPTVRLRFFMESVRSLRELAGRAAPDAETAWLIHVRLLPALLGLAARLETLPQARETISEAASLLYLPSLLDERALAALAPFTAGANSLDVLLRFYRQGTLDARGRRALARSVRLQARSDPAFAAGAPPLLLELLCDPGLVPADRAELIDLVLERLASEELLAASVRDLLAAGFGGPPRDLERYRVERARSAEGVPHPRARQPIRFLSLVLLRKEPGRPLSLARVVREDLPLYEPIYTGDGRGGRAFVGVLLPDETGEHADFVGPPPGLSPTRDHRLLRRGLEGERLSVRTFGARAEELELCAVLPQDGSDPVPAASADLGHLLAFVRGRLERGGDGEETGMLVDLLVRIGTEEAHDLAIRHAGSPAAARAILPLAERGDRGAAAKLLEHLAGLGWEECERALTAAVAIGETSMRERVRALCLHEQAAIAALAADALLAVADPSGIPPLLKHVDPYARACGASLALRLSPLAGALRVRPASEPDLQSLAEQVRAAFPETKGKLWQEYGSWVALALAGQRTAADGRTVTVASLRRDHEELHLGRRVVRPYEFAAAYTEGFREGKAPELLAPMMAFLLNPHDPGRGILRRDLDPLLDVLEEKATGGRLRATWIDALALLAAAQAGIEMDREFLDLAQERLRTAAGDSIPEGARRKPAIYWPLWAGSRRD